MTAATLTGIEAKAVRLVAQGNVAELPPVTRSFRVQSESSDENYIVGVTSDGRGVCCTCPAGQREQRCSHLVAGELTVARELDEHAAAQASARMTDSVNAVLRLMNERDMSPADIDAMAAEAHQQGETAHRHDAWRLARHVVAVRDERQAA